MNSRTLGKSGYQVSEIGLGCWQLGGDFGPLGDEVAAGILAEAAGQGINFWDTADVYGGGISEERIAAFLHDRPAPVKVATKVGRDSGLFPDGYTKGKVRENLEGSLKRLRTETLDLVQLHCVPPGVLEAGDLLAWMEDFQAEGIVRHFGASVQTLAEARVAVRHPNLASLQIIFNLFRQDAMSELFPLAEANEVGIIVRLPLASGILAGKMNADTAFAESDHRHYNRNGEAFSQGETFSGIPYETALALVERIREKVPHGMSMAQMAMRWLLDHPAVTTVIAGASRPEQVRENAAVSQLPPLPGNLHEWLASFYLSEVRSRIVVSI
jgi:aryl-alcohol dehydrogenase-like predicted oxidoreductase